MEFIPPETEGAIRSLVREGEPLEKVAFMTHCSVELISRLLAETPEASALRLNSQKLPTQDIIEILGCDAELIKKALRQPSS